MISKLPTTDIHLHSGSEDLHDERYAFRMQGYKRLFARTHHRRITGS